MDFTKRKFLKQPIERQHKKLSLILKENYRLILEKKGSINFSAYHELMGYMGDDKQIAPDLKSISNAYHVHLKKANQKLKEHNLLPNIRKTDREFFEESYPICIYFDQIRSAHNVGSMLRTIEAFSLGDVFFSKDTPFSTEKQVQDASMGCFNKVNCKKDVQLKDLPKPIIALETSDDAISLFDFTFPEEFTLVVGNEEFGLSDETLKMADTLLEIPLRGRKNSLNVANSLAIAAAEICRQKNERK